jgi:hypothetical protein
MGKMIFGLVFVLITGLAWSQDADDQNPPSADAKAQERIKNLRIAYISEKLGLTSAQAEKFWPIYHEYAQERTKLRVELKTIRSDINKTNPDVTRQKELIDQGLKIKQRELDLEKTYSSRLLQVIDAQQMLNLQKAEQDFRNMVYNTLQQKRLMQERKEMVRDKNQLLRQRNK